MANTTRSFESSLGDSGNPRGHHQPPHRGVPAPQRALVLPLLPVLLALLALAFPAAAHASAPQGWDLVDSSGNLDYDDHTASYGAEIQSAAGAFNAVGAVSAQPASGGGADLQIGESALGPGIGGMTYSDGRMLFPPSKGAYPYTAVAHEFGHAEGLAHVPTGSVTDQDPSTHYEAPTPSDEQVLHSLHGSGGGGGGGSDTGAGDLGGGDPGSGGLGGGGLATPPPPDGGGSDLGGSDPGGGGSLFGGGGLDASGPDVSRPQRDVDRKTDISGSPGSGSPISDSPGGSSLGDGGAAFGGNLAGLAGSSGSGRSRPAAASTTGGSATGSGGDSRCSLDLASAGGRSLRTDVDGFLACMRGGGSTSGAGGAPASPGAGSMPSGGGGPPSSGSPGSSGAEAAKPSAKPSKSGGGASGLSDNDPEKYEGMLEDFLGTGGSGPDE